MLEILIDCKSCKKELPTDAFSRGKGRKWGIRQPCKKCRCLAEKERYNPELKREYNQKYYLENTQKLCSDSRKYYKENKDSVLARMSSYEGKLKGKILSAKRRANKKNSHLLLTKAQHNEIRDIYKEASRLTKDEGIQYHVDHIVPLKGKSVCGLHVPWNLRIITAEENLIKSNKLLEDIVYS